MTTEREKETPMSEGLSKKLAAKIRQLTFHWIQRDDWNEKDWPGLESQIVAVIQPELDRLRAQLAPSPCGVEGHRMADWRGGVTKVQGSHIGLILDCLACARETRLLEDLIEEICKAAIATIALRSKP